MNAFDNDKDDRAMLERLRAAEAPLSVKAALLARTDAILKGLLIASIVMMGLTAVVLYHHDRNERCLAALRDSRNGVIIMSLCKD